MLLVASVVVPHPLWIANYGCVVARDLQVLREGMRPFGRGHHASGPLAVERNQQEGRLSYRGLGLNECLDAASDPVESVEVNASTPRRVRANCVRWDVTASSTERLCEA